jgi:sec-independent protein translocase protein TatA
MPNLGMWEILLILLIALLVFGAKRLPEMGAAMGKGIREFKRSLKDVSESVPESEASSRQIDGPARSGEPKKLSQ